MTFDSIEFGFYLPIVFVIYWLFKGQLKLQNAFIVLASYVFYGWWDWRFLVLIVISTILDFLVGLGIESDSNEKRRKLLLSFSILGNLGILAYFKYSNFFIENFSLAFSLMGNKIDPQRLEVVLPLGISFYTFQTLSYSIDVYRRKIPASRDILGFSAFVSFFPQLVAGPIERASNLLPQFKAKRTFDYYNSVDGLRQILWGLFKKIVIADNCAEFANTVFNSPNDYFGSTLLLGLIFFSFQIYCDFSGYSDMAIGLAKLFGFQIMRNFSTPYFSRDIAEFWRRWHISLSTWFRDYVYIPMGGNLGNRLIKVRNVFVVFLLSGFWHGANWTFIIWGALHAIYFLPLLLFNKNRKNLDSMIGGKNIPSFNEFLNISFTFWLISFSWIFFRAESLTHAFDFLSNLFSISLFSIPQGHAFANASFHPLIILAVIFVMVILEWLGLQCEHPIQFLVKGTNKLVRFLIYYALIASILLMQGVSQEFIYFQF